MYLLVENCAHWHTHTCYICQTTSAHNQQQQQEKGANALHKVTKDKVASSLFSWTEEESGDRGNLERKRES